MTEIEYAGYSFTQSPNSDRYRVRNSRGQIVEHGYEKPNMTMQDAVNVIERYILVNEVVNAMAG